MSKKSKNEYLEKMHERYQGRGRTGRTLLLDEICEVCGYDRKHAIKPMRPGGYRRGAAVKKAGRRATYGVEELDPRPPAPGL